MVKERNEAASQLLLRPRARASFPKVQVYLFSVAVYQTTQTLVLKNNSIFASRPVGQLGSADDLREAWLGSFIRLRSAQGDQPSPFAWD